ncbi:porphobilinogen deaminase [Physcia stellaris]|nr:porphobilinogen deaminase [Physcia stellaris]
MATSPSSHQRTPQQPPKPNPHPLHPPTLRIGTRASALALAQVSLFTTLLSHSTPTLQTTTHSTSTQAGDADKETNLHTLAQSGKSLWTHDLEASLLRGEIDCIVHSLKDVPTKVEEGCIVKSVGARARGGDVLVLRRELEEGREKGEGEGLGKEEEEEEEKKGLASLPPGAVVGTSSVRRSAMVHRAHPHLIVKNVRGNVHTRLRKLDDPANGFDAIIIAGAGVERLGLGERIDAWLGAKEGMLRAVGQGALGVEFREGDEWVEGLVDGVKRRRVEWETRAERSLLRTVEGGCSVPLGCETEWEEEREGRNEGGDRGGGHDEGKGVEDDRGRGVLVMRAMVVSLDGKECVQAERRRVVESDEDAEEAGWEMAQELVEKGAAKILEKITLNRGMIQGQDNA